MASHIKESGKHSLRTKSARHHAKVLTLLGAVVAVIVLVGVAIFLLRTPPLAKVNGEAVSAASVDSEITRLKETAPEVFTKDYGGKSASELQQSILDSLINEKLLTQEAHRRGLRVDSKVLRQSESAIRSKFATDEEYQQFLQENNISESQLSEALSSNLLVAELAKDLVGEKDITDSEARAYFEAHKSKYATTASKHAAQILFAPGDMATATSVRQQIASGADFAALAKKYSKDAGSASHGGDLGWSVSDYPAAFQSALDALKPGEVSQPVTTGYGIHLIKLLEVRGGSARFEDARAQVVADLLGERRAAAVEALLKELLSEAKIEMR